MAKKVDDSEMERVEIMMRLFDKLTIKQWRDIELAFVPKKPEKRSKNEQQRNTVLSC